MNNPEGIKPKYTPRRKTIVLCGVSRLPENITAKHVYGYFTLEVEIDLVDYKIVDFSCTLVPSLGEKLLMNALLGYEVEEGIKNATEEIEARFFGIAKRAIIAAIEEVHKRYIEYRKKNNIQKKNLE